MPEERKPEWNPQEHLQELLARGGVESLVRALRADPALARREDEFGGSLLEAAIDPPNPTAVRVLLEHGARLERTDNSESNPLHLAASCRNNIEGAKTVVDLLLGAGADISRNIGWLSGPPLIYAICWGQLGMIGHLLDRGADIEQPDSDDGDPPLIRAAYVCNYEAAELLAKRGANLQARSVIYGHTAAEIAASNGRHDIAGMLREEEARRASRSGDSRG